MLWLFFALKFIWLLRFPKSTPVVTTLCRRYGQPILAQFRRWEKVWRKLEKTKQDLIFLQRCELYDVVPKFLHFRLYNRRLERSQFYLNWQKQLLQRETRTKEKQVKRLENERRNHGMELKNHVSFIDFNFLLHFLDRSIVKYIKDVKRVHARKLYVLGANLELPVCNPDKVVINLSDYSLSNKEKSILAFGLEHCIPPKFSKLKYFTAFEILYNRVKDLPFFNTSHIEFGTYLKNIAYKLMKLYKNEKRSKHIF